MVERARDQKLDPVIGRDSEIRNVVRIPVSYTHLCFGLLEKTVQCCSGWQEKLFTDMCRFHWYM